MSIINDAIKKAGEDPLPKKRITPEVNMPNKKEKQQKVVTILFFFFAISILIGVTVYRHINLSSVNCPTDINLLSQNPNIKNSAKKELSRSTKNTLINLSGIVYDGDNKKWAIIDDKIMREGDMVSRSKIIEIQKDFVKLKSDLGEEIIFNLN